MYLLEFLPLLFVKLLLVSGAVPPEQAVVPGTVIPRMTTAKTTPARALIVPRKS